MLRRSVLGLLCSFLLLGVGLRADTLVFSNGDEIAGELVRGDASACVFHSDMAGTVTVPWANVRELRTTEAFVVVAKDGSVRQGELLVSGGLIEISSDTAPQPAFLAPQAARMIVDPKTYTAAVTARPQLWNGWRGQVSGGFSQVSATQSSSSYTSNVELQRPVPSLAWLPQRANTIFHFQGAYGQLSQADKPTVKTSIFTSSLEQDQDISARLFLFANAELDHNLSQGLELQQAYGGGLGWKLLQTNLTQLSLKADLHLTRQRFLSVARQEFLASSFSETMRHNYGRLVWTQDLSLTPSYTNGLAYQMSGLSSWAVPVYHALSLNFTVVDSYINNPQPGFLKNSLQISTGLQFSVR